MKPLMPNGTSTSATRLPRLLAASLSRVLELAVVVAVLSVGCATVYLMAAGGAALSGPPSAVVQGLLVPAVGVGVGIAVGVVAGLRLTFPNTAVLLLSAIVPGLIVLAVGFVAGVMGSRGIPGLAIPVWAAGMIMLIVMLRAWPQTAIGPRRWLATGAAGLLIVDLSVTAAVWGSFTAVDAPRAYAATWFPVSLAWDEAGLRPGPPGNVFESMAGLFDATELLPFTLLVLTAFGLSLVSVASVGSRHGQDPDERDRR